MKTIFEFSDDEQDQAKSLLNALDENDKLYLFIYNLEIGLRNAHKYAIEMPWDGSENPTGEMYTWFLKLKNEAGIDEG